jgi:hypothetical protein
VTASPLASTPHSMRCARTDPLPIWKVKGLFSL